MSDQPEPPATPVTPQTPWQRALAMSEQGASAGDIAVALTADGLDAESVRVVVNSLPNAPPPPTLPSARVDFSTNLLAPNTVALFELGLEGDRNTVGLYWMAFGGVLTLMSAGFWALMNATEPTGPWAEFAAVTLPVFVVVALLGVARGAWLWKSSVRIRRRG